MQSRYADHTRAGARSVHKQGDGIRTRRVDGDAGVTEAHRRFGGIDVPATLAGTVAALGTAVLVAGILAGAGTVGYQKGLAGTEELSLGSLVAGLATLLVAFLVGGWVAGRIARYDGGRNGVLTAIWFLALAALTSGLGAWLGDKYDVFPSVRLPQWFSADARTAAAVATGLLALAVMLVAGWLGGRLGERYHRQADALIATTRDGGIARPAQARVR